MRGSPRKAPGAAVPAILWAILSAGGLWLGLTPDRRDQGQFAARMSAGNPVFAAAKVLAESRRESILVPIAALAASLGAGAAILCLIRDKARARARLAQEARHRITLMSVADGVIAIDASGRVDLMNPAAERLTGWYLEEARGKPLPDVLRIVDENTRQPVEDPGERVLREGRSSAAIPALLISRDGAEHPIAVSAGPIRTPEGAIGGAALAFRDRTAEREAEKELRDAEERFRSFFDNAPVGKSITTPEGRLLRVNPALCRMLGYTREELQEKSFAAITHPDDLPESRECIRSLLAGERETWTMEKRYLHREGHPVWARVTTALQRDGQRRPQFFLTHIVDITERKKAEEALRRISARHEAILQTMPDIVMEVDANKVYTWANPAGLEFFGDDVLGKEASAYFVGEQETYNVVQPIFTGAGDLVYVESWQRRRDGEKRLLAWWCRSLRDPDGRVAGALSTARDVTDWRKTEKALKESLAEKTALLQEVHHRVKNNLQIVMSLLNLQASRLRSAPAAEALRETRNRVRSMALLHERLYRAGNLDRVDLGAYLSELCPQMGRSFGVNPEQVRIEVSARNASLSLAKAVPCGLIVSELVSNALKHAFPAGRPGRILVEAERLEDGRVAVTVRDDGIGLPPEADPDRAGTLGWELVRNLTDQLKGTLAVERGQGTLLRLAFPDDPAPAPPGA